MKLEECCEKYFGSVAPRSPRAGRFTEIHKCRGCKQMIKIIFEGQAAVGGAVLCSAVSAEEVN